MTPLGLLNVHRNGGRNNRRIEMTARYRPPESRGQSNRALTKATPKPPKELAGFFADPPLVGDESRENYDNLWSVIAAAAKPADGIVWIYVRHFANLTWEIQREIRLKVRVIEDARKAVVTQLLMPAQIDQSLDDGGELDSEREAEIERMFEEMKQWQTDPRARRRIEKELADEGFDADYILTDALTDCADRIDAIDRRILNYENRRNAVLREIDRYRESLARKLDRVASDIIDGEFTEAAE